MEIVKIEPVFCESIETTEKEYNRYTRYGPDSWFVAIGESDEPVYGCDDLEKLYQEFKKTHT